MRSASGLGGRSTRPAARRFRRLRSRQAGFANRVLRAHGNTSIWTARSEIARAIKVKLDSVVVRISEVARLAHAMIARAFPDGSPRRSGDGAHPRGPRESGRGSRDDTSRCCRVAGPFRERFRKCSSRCDDDSRLPRRTPPACRSVASAQSQGSAVEAQCALQVGDLQVHVSAANTRIKHRHAAISRSSPNQQLTPFR